MLTRHPFFVPMRGRTKETNRLDKSDGRKSKMTNDTTRAARRLPACLFRIHQKQASPEGRIGGNILALFFSISSVLRPGHGLFRVLRFAFLFFSFFSLFSLLSPFVERVSF